MEIDFNELVFFFIEVQVVLCFIHLFYFYNLLQFLLAKQFAIFAVSSLRLICCFMNGFVFYT